MILPAHQQARHAQGNIDELAVLAKPHSFIMFDALPLPEPFKIAFLIRFRLAVSAIALGLPITSLAS